MVQAAPVEPARREQRQQRCRTCVCTNGATPRATWNERLIDLTVEDTQGDYNNIIAIHPSNENIVFHGTRGLSWTSDGGATFMGVNAGHGDPNAWSRA